MKIEEAKLKELKDYFEKTKEVALAFLFGSQAKNLATKESDFDIAIYFKPETRELEWENQTREYELENKIWSDVEKITGRDVDLVVLNRVRSTVAYAAIKEGIPLSIKDKNLFWSFYLLISSAAEYFRDFIDDFWIIRQRSHSLSDIDRARLIEIAEFLERELAEKENFLNLDQINYQQDSTQRRNCERWIENLVNASIDMAKIILSSENKPLPDNYREILSNLSLVEGFNSETALGLGGFSRLRNILAHEYLDIRFKKIKEFLNNGVPLTGKLLDFIKHFLNKKS